MTARKIIETVCPELFGSPSLEVYLHMAAETTDKHFFGSLYNYAVAYKACHLFTVMGDSQGGGGSGNSAAGSAPIASMSEGGMSISYAVSASSEGSSDMENTKFGKLFLSLGLAQTIKGLTPLFETLGNIVGGIIGPVLGVAVAVKGITTAVSIGKGVVSGIKAVQTAYGLLAGTMSIMRAASEGNRLALLMLDAQMLKTKIQTIACTIVQKAQAIASNIAAAAQMALNVVMSMNPIGLIIIGVIALIAAIVLLVKNWDKVGPAIMKALAAVGNFFKMIGSAIAGFFKAIWNTIVGYSPK